MDPTDDYRQINLANWNSRVPIHEHGYDLERFRDERKRQIVLRLANGLEEVNRRMIERFTENIDHIEDVLERVSSRADKAAAHGVDIAAVRSAIVSAESAIAAARAAITVQAGKTYPVNLTDESTARADVAAAKQALESDLKAVRALVQTARDAVHAAAVALAGIPRVDDYEVEPPTPTSTTTSTP